MRVKIPRLFAEDHDIGRQLPSGDWLDANNRYMTYFCSREELEGWLEDAKFYADLDHWKLGGPDWYRDGGREICISAKRALPHIRAAILTLEATQKHDRQPNPLNHTNE
jgi:hypothetical protein